MLEQAKWNVDPTELDPSVQELWLSVEFGDYASVAKQLIKASNNRQPEIKKSAQVLLAYVNEKLTAVLDDAKSAQESGELWSAYKQYLTMREQFGGYETDINLATVLKELKADKTVANELAARKYYERAERRFPKVGMDRTLGMLKGLIEKYPGTEAANASQKIIDSQ